MRYILTVLLTVCAVALQAAEAQRVAVVNVEKVFREYYKSKIAEGAIKQQAEIYRSHLLKLNDQLRQLEKEFELARDNAQNLAFSEEARNKAADLARAKGQAVAEQRAAIQSYATDRNRKMRDFELERRQEIIRDINAEIKRRAEAGKYDLVLDSGGKTTNDLPAVIFFRPGMDLTAEVIKQLNATASVAGSDKK